MSGRVETDIDVREAYATDASGLRHLPEGVARPDTLEEVVDILERAGSAKYAVTPAGAQTSTTGASVAESGVILSMRGMDRVLDLDRSARTLRVQPGALVADVKRVAEEEGLMFAPDPTSENECTIGGAIACNASGARTLKYGATRQHVRALTVVLASGEVARLRRTELEKNTAGYALAQNPLDWFVGSEGTLGVIVEAELDLLPRPEAVTGAAFPFASEADALAFVVAARGELDRLRSDRLGSTSVDPRCMEYFDDQALQIARSADHVHSWAAGAAAMVYVEQEHDADGADKAIESWLTLAETHGAFDDVRAFATESELRHARAMRHAVPATMNERGSGYRATGGRKVSTDWAVPYRQLPEAIAHSRHLARVAGIDQAVTYGHAGNGHPHQNYLAFDGEHLERIERVIEATLAFVVEIGGTVSAEHGIGKLKRRWLPMQMSPMTLGVMKAVKRELDPRGILAPGNIFG